MIHCFCLFSFACNLYFRPYCMRSLDLDLEACILASSPLIHYFYINRVNCLIDKHQLNNLNQIVFVFVCLSILMGFQLKVLFSRCIRFQFIYLDQSRHLIPFYIFLYVNQLIVVLSNCVCFLHSQKHTVEYNLRGEMIKQQASINVCLTNSLKISNIVVRDARKFELNA